MDKMSKAVTIAAISYLLGFLVFRGLLFINAPEYAAFIFGAMTTHVATITER